MELFYLWFVYLQNSLPDKTWRSGGRHPILLLNHHSYLLFLFFCFVCLLGICIVLEKETDRQTDRQTGRGTERTTETVKQQEIYSSCLTMNPYRCCRSVSGDDKNWEPRKCNSMIPWVLWQRQGRNLLLIWGAAHATAMSVHICYVPIGVFSITIAMSVHICYVPIGVFSITTATLLIIIWSCTRTAMVGTL